MRVRFIFIFFPGAQGAHADQAVLAMGVGQPPVGALPSRRLDLFGREVPTLAFATVHAPDHQPLIVEGEIEGMQAIDQQHVAVVQGIGKGGHQRSPEEKRAL